MAESSLHGPGLGFPGQMAETCGVRQEQANFFSKGHMVNI